MASGKAPPIHLQRGKRGELEAQRFLKRKGYRLLARNFASPRGEIDLVFRQRDCLVFVEVKTRSSEQWGRPASAVKSAKRRHLSLAALDYLRLIGNPKVPIRFDIVEVVLRGEAVAEIRHWENCFPLSEPLRYD